MRTQPKYEFPTPKQLIEEAKKVLKNENIDDVTFVKNLKEEDLEKILKFYYQQEKDIKISYFLAVLSSIAEATKLSQKDVLKDIFASLYFNLPNASLDLKTILGLIINKHIILGQGANLHDLVRAPYKYTWYHWLQFFSIDVNLRSLVNAFFPKEKPFPYAPDLKSLSSWEIRIFGFPTLIFNKEKVAEEIKVGLDKYAIIIKGDNARYIENKEEFEKMVDSGELKIIGYTGEKVDGKIKDSIPIYGRGDGGVVIFGKKATEEYQKKIKEDIKNLQNYGNILNEGGVIVQTTEDKRIKTDFWVGKKYIEAQKQIFAKLLSNPAYVLTGNYDKEFKGWFEYEEDGVKKKVIFVYSVEDVTKSVIKEKVRYETMQQLAEVYRQGGIIVNKQQDGKIIGLKEIRLGIKEISKMLDKIDKLPALEKTKISFNKYTNILIDIDGDGKKELLTIVFPTDATIERYNSLTYEMERCQYKDGKLLSIVSPTKIVKLEYDKTGLEAKVKIYTNIGSLIDPHQGKLIREIISLEYNYYDEIHRITSQAQIYTKVERNTITNKEETQICGIYFFPIKRISSESIIETEYDEFGKILKIISWKNKNGEKGEVIFELEREKILEIFRDKQISQPEETQLKNLRKLCGINYHKSVLDKGVFVPLIVTRESKVVSFISASIVSELKGIYTLKIGNMILGYYGGNIYVYEVGQGIVEAERKIENTARAGLVPAVVGKENIKKDYKDIGSGVYIKEWQEGSKLYRDYIKEIGGKYYRVYLSKKAQTVYSRAKEGLGVIAPDVVTLNDPDAIFDIYTADELNLKTNVATKHLGKTIYVSIDGGETYNYIFEVSGSIRNREAVIERSGKAGFVEIFIGGVNFKEYKEIDGEVWVKEWQENGKVYKHYIKRIGDRYCQVYMSKKAQETYSRGMEGLGVVIPDLVHTYEFNAIFDIYAAEDLCLKPNNVATKQLSKTIYVSLDGGKIHNYIYEVGKGVKNREAEIEKNNKAGLIEAFIGSVDLQQYKHTGSGVYIKEWQEGSKLYRDYIKEIGGKYYRVYLSKKAQTVYNIGMEERLGILIPNLFDWNDVDKLRYVYNIEDIKDDEIKETRYEEIEVKGKKVKVWYIKLKDGKTYNLSSGEGLQKIFKDKKALKQVKTRIKCYNKITLENIVKAELWHALVEVKDERGNDYAGVKALNYLYGDSEDVPEKFPESNDSLEKGLTPKQIDFLSIFLYKPKVEWVKIRGLRGLFERGKIVIKDEKGEVVLENTDAWDNPKKFVANYIQLAKWIEELRKPQCIFKICSVELIKIKGIEALKVKGTTYGKINIPDKGPIKRETMEQLETFLWDKKGEPRYDLKHPQEAVQTLINSYVLSSFYTYLFIAGVLIAIPMLGWLVNKFRTPRKKNLNTIASLNELNDLLKKANLSLCSCKPWYVIFKKKTTTDVNERKIEENIRSLSKKLIVLRTLHRGAVSQVYVTLYLDSQEQQWVNKAIENNYLEIKFDEKYDITKQLRAPPRIYEKIIRNRSRRLIFTQEELNHPLILTLSELLPKLGIDKLQQVINAIPESHKGAVFLEDLINGIVNKIEEYFIENKLPRINNKDTLQNELRNLPPTSGVLFIKHLIDNDVVEFDVIRRISLKLPNMYYLARQVIKYIASPEFGKIKTAIFGEEEIKDEFGKNLLEEQVFEYSIDEIMPEVLRNPKLIVKREIDGKIEINLQRPILESFQPINYREELIKRILQLNQTYTQNHSFGALSAIWPLVMYVARKVDKMINEGKSTADIRNVINETALLFKKLLPEQMAEIQKTTTRSATKPLEMPLSEFFLDVDVYALFQILQEKNIDIYELDSNTIRENFLHICKLAKQQGIAVIPGDNLIKILIILYGENKQATATALKKDTLKLFRGKPYQEKFPGVEKKEILEPFVGPDGNPITIQPGWQEIKNTFKLLYWERIFKPLLNPFEFNFWSINAKTKIAKVGWGVMFVIGLGLLVSGLLGSFVIGPLTFNIATTLITGSWFLPRLWLSKTDIPGMKTFFTVIFLAFLFYWGGILGGEFLIGIPMFLFSNGFIFWPIVTVSLTFLVLLMVSVPTFISLWDIIRMFLGALKWYQDTWSKTAQKNFAWKVVGEFLLFGVISFILSSFLIGLTSPYFVLVFLGMIIILSLLSVGKIFLPITTGIGWERIFRNLYNEFQKVEENNGYILPTHQTVKEYLEDLIEDLYSKFHLTKDERDKWLRSICNPKCSKFVRPKSKIAQEILTVTFDTLSKKKPIAEDLKKIQTLTTHVQGAGEIFAFKWEFVTHPNSFDIRRNLLGYLARNYRVEWDNLIEMLDTKCKDLIEELHKEIEKKLCDGNEEDKRKLLEFVNKLKNFNKNTHISSPEASSEQAKALLKIAVDIQNLLEFVDKLEELDENTYIFLPEVSSKEGKNLLKDNIIISLEEWVNEIRPSNYAVCKSMHKQHIAWHIYAAGELCDWEYQLSVREISKKFPSLKVAYEKYEEMSRKTEAQRTEEEKNFLNKYSTFWGKYEMYNTIVQQKHKMLFNDDVFRNQLININNEGRIIGISSLDKIKEIIEELRKRDVPVDEVLDIKNIKNEASPYNWAKNFFEFRVKYMREIQEVLKETLIAKESLLSEWNNLCKTADIIYETERRGLNYCYLNRSDNIIPRNKNAGLARDLWQYVGKAINHDALIRIYLGQEVWTQAYATLLGNLRYTAVINFAMKLWAKLGFPVTENYAVAQETRTSEVQRALRGGLTFYGKGGIIPQIVALYTPPAEDTAAFLMLQTFNPEVNSTQVDWLYLEWGRPTILADSISLTELRYSYNVTRVLFDLVNYPLFLNPNLGFDRKLIHILLWLYYINVPFILGISLFVIPLLFFSSYAFLTPYFLFVVLSFILLNIINFDTLFRHIREAGSFLEAIRLIFRYVVKGFFMWVSIIPLFWVGIVNAVNERFNFIRTRKESRLQIMEVADRFESVNRHIAKWGVLGVISTANSLGLFVFLNYFNFLGWSLFILGVWNPLIYFLVSIVWINGINAFRAFIKDGKLQPFNPWENIKWASFVYILFLGIPLLGVYFSLPFVSFALPVLFALDFVLYRLFGLSLVLLYNKVLQSKDKKDFAEKYAFVYNFVESWKIIIGFESEKDKLNNLKQDLNLLFDRR